MTRLVTLLVFAVLVVLQLAVPASMIEKRQSTLAQGAAYKFSIGPVDPYDPFLGRYLVLNLEVATFPDWKGEPLHKGQTIFAVLAKDADGFATITNLSMDAPGRSDYLKARVAWQSGQQVQLALPFSRYYLQEEAAQLAWRVRPDPQQQPVPAYILVKLKAGFGVLEDLYFEDRPIMDYMRDRGVWPPEEAKQAPVSEGCC